MPPWRKKLRSNCQPKKLPAKPVRLFSKVTSHRNNKEMTEEKKYDSRDDDGNINFTKEHQLDGTDDINMVNTNDSDGSRIQQNQDGFNRTNASDRDERSILQNHDGGQYQGQHTASSWAYNNQSCTILLPGSVAYNFSSFSGLHQGFVPANTYWVTTFQQCKHYKFFEGVKMLVIINVFCCFTATAASICIKISVHHCNDNEPNATSASN